MQCANCGSQVIPRGIQMVCIGCGAITRSNLLFSTEQDFQQINVKRTTQHIKQRQDRDSKVTCSLQRHLQLHWFEYLQAYSKQMYIIAAQLSQDVKPLWKAFLQMHANRVINSNWTIARQGHEIPSRNRIVNSKYVIPRDASVETAVKVEEDQSFEKELRHFEQEQQNSVLEISMLKKTIKKTKIPFYARRKFKIQLKTGPRTNSGRKLSVTRRRQSIDNKRRGSIDLNLQIKTKEEYMQSVLQLNITELIYQSIVEMYYESYYRQSDNNLKSQIQKIKNIKSYSTKHNIIHELITLDQLAKLPAFMQIEVCFLLDFASTICGTRSPFMVIYAQFIQTEFKDCNYSQRNIQFLKRKFRQVYEEFNSRNVPVKNEFPIDFTLVLVILYAQSLRSDVIIPRELIYKVKCKEISFLDGFPTDLNQYLAYPQHIPKAEYIRKQGVKFLKYMNITETASNFDKTMQTICTQLNQDYQYTYSLQKAINIQVNPSQWDLYICALLLVNFKITNNLEYINGVQLYLSSMDILPLDYKDLEFCSLQKLQQSLYDEVHYDSYYMDKEVNSRISTQISKIQSYFADIRISYPVSEQSASLPETSRYNQEFKYFVTQDFSEENSSTQYLYSLLQQYLDGEVGMLKYFYEIERKFCK